MHMLQQLIIKKNIYYCFCCAIFKNIVNIIIIFNNKSKVGLHVMVILIVKTDQLFLTKITILTNSAYFFQIFYFILLFSMKFGYFLWIIVCFLELFVYTKVIMNCFRFFYKQPKKTLMGSEGRNMYKIYPFP